METCTGCGKNVPDINVEFGGGTHVYNLDGDLYCKPECIKESMERFMKVCSDPSRDIWQVMAAAGPDTERENV